MSLPALHELQANLISATPANYASFAGSLQPGDTLSLAPGNYMQQLNLNNRNGTPASPIVILGAGNATVFLANACCNTVNLTNCSYLIIKNFKIDGQHINYVDGIKAGGGGNNFAHHITIENILIVNNGGNIPGDNQTVGISTKCAAWGWVIRKCMILGAGTGIYLGNSDATSPFVGGLIENNLVINSRGYNMQIKGQKDGVRDIFPETAIDSQKTIIRYNVWSKDSGSTPIGFGDGSRPCLLMDHFPATGPGANDRYEVYGNFFYNNPTEALMQVTGNTTAYNNIFINHVAPSGYGPVVLNHHDGFPPRAMNVFHNTVVSNSEANGIHLVNPDPGYEQYCYANAVFTDGMAIEGFKAANTADNISGMYMDADEYVTAPFSAIPGLDLYPLVGALQGSLTDQSLFATYTDFDLDFNGNLYDWTYRGAYSGSGSNPGWTLQLDTLPTPHGTVTGTQNDRGSNDFLGILYPNPANQKIQLDVNVKQSADVLVTLSDLEGHPILTLFQGKWNEGFNEISAELPGLVSGFYVVSIRMNTVVQTRKVLIQN